MQAGDPARGAVEYTRTLNEMNEFLREEPSGYQKILSNVSKRVRNEYRNNRNLAITHARTAELSKMESPKKTFISSLFLLNPA